MMSMMAHLSFDAFICSRVRATLRGLAMERELSMEKLKAALQLGRAHASSSSRLIQ